MSHQLDIQVAKPPNLDLLWQQMLTAMPTTCTGGGYSRPTMTVSVTFSTDPVSAADIATAQAVCAAHDPTQQSQAQIAAAQAVQQQATLKSSVGAIVGELESFDPSTITDLASMVAAFDKQRKDLILLVQAVETFL